VPEEAPMLGRLVPREAKFFDLFNAHAERIVEGSRELAAMIGRFDQLDAHAQRIDAAERAADKLTHECITLLHRTFITPFDRDQIHSLITKMDDILDLIQDVAESIALYDLRAVTPEAKQLAEICEHSCQRVRSRVALLTNIKSSAAILKLCEEIDRLESDADRVMRSAMSKLFREENDLKQVMKLRVIYDLLESITDRCEDVANIIEGIVLENS
jgi:predicted phosphate transport protein (TIGR00153 family)